MEAQLGERVAMQMATPKSWWDDRFTRLLLSQIPSDCRQLVDYGCGQANAAYSLLPALPDAHYIGLESDADQLREAERQVASTRYAPRVSLRVLDGLELPVADGLSDVFLSVMRLQHCEDIKAMLSAEVPRVLAEGGRFIAVEPDNLGQRFYFDGVLEQLDQCFHTFCLRARVLRQPADIALGPRLPQLLKRYDYRDIGVELHLVGSTRYETAKSFCDRVLRITDQTAQMAGIYEQAEEYQAVLAEVRRFQFTGLPKRLGYSAHLVPAFCVTATRTPK
jgi:ubiquinone/menaquinone biosynthesis C-methylase UbiE